MKLHPQLHQYARYTVKISVSISRYFRSHQRQMRRKQQDPIQTIQAIRQHLVILMEARAAPPRYLEIFISERSIFQRTEN